MLASLVASLVFISLFSILIVLVINVYFSDCIFMELLLSTNLISFIFYLQDLNISCSDSSPPTPRAIRLQRLQQSLDNKDGQLNMPSYGVPPDVLPRYELTLP